MPDAVLFIPEHATGPSWRTGPSGPVERLRWVDVLADYCTGRGYTVVAVCSDLATAIAMQADKPGCRLILGRVDWLPDMEIVTMPATHPAINARQRRPMRRPQMVQVGDE